MFIATHWDPNGMGIFVNSQESTYGASWRGENIDDPTYFIVCLSWLYKKPPHEFQEFIVITYREI